MRSVIDSALARTTVPTLQPHDVKAELVELTEHRNNLLPAEAAFGTWIDARARQLERDVRVYDTAHTGRDTPLQVLDPAVLTWRHARSIRGIPVPRFALVDVFCQPLFRITPPHSGMTYGGASCAELFETQYADVQAALQKRSGRKNYSGRVASLSYTYASPIPTDVKAMIEIERTKFSGIFLLAEAPLTGWTYTGPKRRDKYADAIRAKLDPLVLGYNKDAHALFLLGQFDATPIEQYVALEFTSRKALNPGT